MLIVDAMRVVTLLAPSLLGNEDRKNVEHAVRSFFFILPRNSMFTLAEFADAILAHYDETNERVMAVCQSLREAGRKLEVVMGGEVAV